MKFKISIWTGPTIVREIAAKIREAGVTVTVEGTETVYAVADGQTAEGAAWNVLVDLRRVHGTDFGLRPRPVSYVPVL